MLNQQTIEKLYTMRMRGMADAFTQQQEDPQSTQLSFEERFALLVDRQWNWRQNRALERRLRDGRLQGPACIEDIDFRAARGLDKQVVRPLIQDSDWVRRHQHIFLIGPTGIGKTFLARPSDRRPAGMASRPISPQPRSCFGNSNWVGPTAAMARSYGPWDRWTC
jgi:DNA replication protein DnaC